MFMVEYTGQKHRKRAVSQGTSVKVDRVLRVRDGDTFYCDISHYHPLLGGNIGVRIRGIDAPELKSESAHVQLLAIDAKTELLKIIMDCKELKLHNMSRGKYFRLIADVKADGKDVATMLLQKHVVKKYDGKTKPVWE